MIVVRRHLVAHARVLFENELCGLFSWDEDVVLHPAEPNELLEGGRRNPLGKWRDSISMSFGHFRLEIESADEHPPLGQASLFHDGRLACEGALDALTWTKIGARIKESQ